MKKIFKIGFLSFIGLVALVIIASIVSSGGEDTSTVTTVTKADVKKDEDVENKDKKEKSDTKKDKKEKKKETIAKIGDTLKVGDVEFKVNKFSSAKELGGEYGGAQSKGKYLVVNVTVTNRGKEELLVDSSFFKVKSDGKEYSSDGSAGIYANTDTPFFLTGINPDIALTGNVVFDLPPKLHKKELTLQVQTGLFGTETGKIELK